ncbi:two-component system, OmpR family, sensor histidine kinase KdpD [Parafrankia irregularis]|uniref:histidine kinase n=1 Tax=Parafrankia irregularis TaxID=795642 RepID=A0A0S4QV56_9ACTN|nr:MULTISPECIES: sensor histidine kinase KdpD [Parafrankia]MBE3201555.1 sensor histidine kinase KdpD [Parafrankia sp. CH37]CUU59373.1 two-component system, OmpR family, sensor histidine kinase KdpD [Parafrankia irregularis]
MTRGTLRIYLGAAPGVGKTYAALDEAHRRAERGTDVVVGFVETHGRPRTSAMLDGLEIVPRQILEYRGGSFTEMDLDGILARQPQVAFVDELAHTNIPGSRHEKRWQDIQDLLAAGIDVISTVNVQHLESLNDVVETITGVPQRETVPDEVVRRADQVELVDMAPEALRRRMAHGNIYGPEKVDAALANYFRVGNLTALRELALLWLAGKVDDQLDRYRTDHGIGGTWETRERVVVALTGGPEGDTLIRRASRIAARSKGADLLAVHVARSDGLTGADPSALARQRTLVESLGGSYHQVIGDDVPTALLDFARAENTTQLVLGASRRGRLAHMLSPGIGVTTTSLSGPIDVHLVTHPEAWGHRPARTGAEEEAPRRIRGWRLPDSRSALEPRRRILGTLLTLALVPALTAGLTSIRGTFNLTTEMLAYLLITVTVALVGGFGPALFCAIASSLLLNYYFTEPINTWSIADGDNVLALLGFVLVAGLVGRVVSTSARRYGQAVRASAEAATLSTLAGSVLRGENALPALLAQAQETFGMTSVTLLERTDDDQTSSEWRPVMTVGDDQAPAGTGARHDGDRVNIPVRDDLCLALTGRSLPAADRRILTAFAAQAAVALDQHRLREAAAEAAPIAAADKVRTALLTAVSHDLRTPLAAAKASISGLRGHDITLTDDEQAELLATADESLDKLTRLVENLLDMSRLQAGALSVFPRPIGLDDIVPPALDEIGPPANKIIVQVSDDLPAVHADPALLERVIVNLVANALRHAPAGTPPIITASALAGRVELRVIDRGPGIPPAQHDNVFQPFQRLGDHDNTTGVGLGLALSRGLTEAMGGTLTPEETPGGGLTMVLSLPAAPNPVMAPQDAPGQPPAQEPEPSVGP